MKSIRLLLLVLLSMMTVVSAMDVVVKQDDPFADVTRGALRVVKADGVVVECPLKNSAYAVDIAGPVAQVTLVQTFTNPFPETIEAVYVFPLSHDSGVNSLEMEIGERRIVGALMRRGDAAVLYEKAKATGRTASLLDQERPNIFTQKIANLPPGGEVRIRIGYVERLAYDRGAYEFHLPLVVGPRFIPGSPISGVVAPDPAVAAVTVPVVLPPGDGAPKGTGWSPDTPQVPDASRITPPVLKPGVKPPFDVSIAVRIDAGLAIRDVRSVHHRVHLARADAQRATIALDPTDGVPNKDFVVRYAVDGERPAVGVVGHRAADGGYLLLTLQPGQLDQALEQRVPRDLCFLVDVSGSMSGAPLAKVKEAMSRFLTLAGPQDRLQVVTFAGSAHTCFPDYLPATPENIRVAISVIERKQAGGGTDMLAGIQAVLAAPVDPARQRVVVMLTDGYIGNEAEIIKELGERLSDRLRFWCLGIGNSVNRFLVDGVAEAGGGMGVVLGVHEDAVPVVNSMMTRIQRPQLDQVEIDWGGLTVSQVMPPRIGNLWSGQPVRIAARCVFDQAQTVTVTVRGRREGEVVAIPVTVTLDPVQQGTSAVRTIWARERSARLQRDLVHNHDEETIIQLTDLSLRYSLMSPYTSFVAVDERIVNPGGTGRRIDVAVPLPDGVGISAMPVMEAPPMEEASAADLLVQYDVAVHSGSTGAFMAIGAGGGTVGMFGARSGGGKRRALAKGGGSRASESAVDAGLRFLRRHQNPDGSWEVVGYVSNCTEAPKCEAGIGGADDQVAVTAQAVLGFLGGGYDHKTPNKYRTTVEAALTFLMKRQQADGALATTVAAHTQALAALGEAFAMTNDPTLKLPTERGIAWLLARRMADAHGKPLAWGDGRTFDAALTLDAVQALKAAIAGGLDVGDGLERATVWTSLAWRAENPAHGGLTAAQESRFPARLTSAGLTQGEDTVAGALLVALLGHPDGAIAADSLLLRLRQTTAAPTAGVLEPRHLYLGTQAGFHAGGEWWTWWHGTHVAAVPGAQRKGDGCFDGSWDPPTTMTRGRLQSTVLVLRTLEVVYAYQRMHPAPAKP